MKNLTDNIINKLKNIPVIAVIIILGGAIIYLANVSDGITKLSSHFGEKEAENKSAYKAWVDLNFKLVNHSSRDITIINLVEYYVTESDGLIIHEYPRGRVVLNRFPTSLESPNTIKANSDGEFNLEFPKSTAYEDLLLRGSGNVHFFILEEGNKEPYMVSIPFHRQYFGEKKAIKVELNKKT